MTLDLDEYRTAIHLDEPFGPPMPIFDPDEQERVVAELLGNLMHEGNARSSKPAHQDARQELYARLIARPPRPLPDWFHKQLDGILQAELAAREVVSGGDLQRIDQAYLGSACSSALTCALWQGDITLLNIDAIVNAANEQLLGCFIPFHRCIDNAIHAAAGPRLREDCATIMTLQGQPEPTGEAKITRAYNLPSRFVVHTVGPVVGGGGIASPKQENQLASCYASCMDVAARVPEIKSIAFCNISTGVFGFPKVRAAEIALETVGSWLADHPSRLDLVVFDVFGAEDRKIYENVLEKM
jgi:O-acetyl-ADP-ribose deacetylase (regulator of RNase III)